MEESCDENFEKMTIMFFKNCIAKDEAFMKLKVLTANCSAQSKQPPRVLEGMQPCSAVAIGSKKMAAGEI